RIVFDEQYPHWPVPHRGGVPWHWRSPGAGFGRHFDSGELNAKRRALSHARAGGAEHPAMSSDQRLGNRQAETQSARATRAGSIPLLKRMEQAAHLLGCDPHSGVGDVDRDGSRLRIARSHGDRPAWRSELPRVVQEVPEDLLDPSGVSVNVMALGL